MTRRHRDAETAPKQLPDCIVRIHQCSELKASDRLTKSSDPYVLVYLLQKESLVEKVHRIQSWRTPVIKRSVNPAWSETDGTFSIKVFTPGQALRFDVWDHDIISRDDFLGTLSLSFEELLLHKDLGPFRINLKPRKAKDKGYFHNFFFFFFFLLSISQKLLFCYRIEGSITLSVSFPNKGSVVTLLHGPDTSAADEVYFVWNGSEFEGAQAPKMLRTCRDAFRAELVEQLLSEGGTLPSREALDDLRISGSAQFGKAGLGAVRDAVVAAGGVAELVVVCDLRGEPHMVLNGFPVSWYNKGDKLGSNLPPVECDELTRKYVRTLSEHSEVDVRKVLTKGEWGTPEETRTQSVAVTLLQTEEMLVHREFGMGYNRVPITDHEAPELADADQLVAFYQSSPPSLWWHFHCAGGKGRTTTAMVLIDMLRTRHLHPLLSAQDIVNRQWLIGGLRLDPPETPAEHDRWKHRDAQTRRQFIELFYRYTRDTAAHRFGLMFFSTWITSKKIQWPPVFND